MRVVMLVLILPFALRAMEEKKKSSCFKWCAKKENKDYFFAETDDEESDELFSTRIKSMSDVEPFSLKINKITFLLSLNDNLTNNTRDFTIKKQVRGKKPVILWEKSLSREKLLPVVDRFSLSPNLSKIIVNGHYEKQDKKNEDDDNTIESSFFTMYDCLQKKEIAVKESDYVPTHIIASAISSDGSCAAILQDKYLTDETQKKKTIAHLLHIIDTSSSKIIKQTPCLSDIRFSLTIFHSWLVMGFNKQGTKIIIHIPKTAKNSEVNEIYPVFDSKAESAFE